MMSNNPDEKNKHKFNLTPLPVPPPSIEEITRGMQGAGSSRRTPPPEPPGARKGMAPLSSPPEPPAMQAVPQAYYAPDAMVAALQQENLQIKQALAQARQAIEAKESEVTSFNSSFKEIQSQLAQVGDMLKAKDSEIEGLRSSVELLGAEAKNKDAAVFRSKAKIEVLEESVSRSKHEALAFQKKAEEIHQKNVKTEAELQGLILTKAALQSKLDEVTKSSLTEVEALRAEKFQINDRLLKRVAEVEDQEKNMLALRDEITTLKHKLGMEIESKKALESKPAESTARIVRGRDAIIEIFNQLLGNAIHNVMIVVPSIKDLQELDLMKLKPSVKVMISVRIDMKSQPELDYVSELGKLNKLDIRSFDNEDRFGINVDRGVVFIGINSKAEPFGLLTEDPQAIDLLVKQFLIETWTLGRPVGSARR